MNLQTIQKRVEELTAELLTVSNDLAFLISGDVTRQPVVTVIGSRVRKFSDLVKGDRIVIPHDFQDIDEEGHKAGTYTVTQVERESYAGNWDVAVQTGEDEYTWLSFSSLHNITKEA